MNAIKEYFEKMDSDSSPNRIEIDTGPTNGTGQILEINGHGFENLC